jgi:type II secretory pathway pseudopilin PulG
MKAFFNNIKERWVKYLIETFVIVIGILGAFAIESWGESRKENEEEHRLLIQLKQEYEQNLSQLNSKISIRNELINSAEILLEVIDKKKTLSQDSFDLYLSRTLVTPTFDPVNNDLAVSGKLYILNNEELRIALSHWSSNVLDVIEEEEIWLGYRDEHYLPFLIEHYSVRTLMSHVWADFEITGQVLIEKTEQSNISMGKSNRKLSYHDLINDSPLEDHLAIAITTNNLTNLLSITVKERIQDMLDLINSELQK